jgi:hypothetical protein
VDVAEELGGGGLAVGARYGEEPVGDRAPGELQLPHHRDAALARRRDHRRLPRHAGALDHGLDAAEQIGSVRIQDDFDARPRKPLRPLGLARVHAPHARPASREQARRGAPGAGQADDQEGALGQGRAGLARRRSDSSSFVM